MEEDTRRKHKRRPRRYQTRPWLVEERRSLYGHYSRLIEELRVEDAVLLQLPQDGACHVR